MATNPIRELTDLAIEMFNAQPGMERSLQYPGFSGLGDPVLDGALSPGGVLLEIYDGPALPKAVNALEQDPAMDLFASREGEHDPMFSSAMGGSRQDMRGLVIAMVTSALRIMYFASMEQTPEVLVRHVIENYEALRKIGRGEAIPIPVVHGLTGVRLSAGTQIATPWGVVKAAPEPSGQSFSPMGHFRPRTTAVLLRSAVSKVEVSRDDSPTGPELDVDFFETDRRIRELLPLAFALAIEGERRCAPVITFTTSLPPYSSGIGASSATRLGSSWQETIVEVADIPAIEEWARRLNTRHVDNLQVTARRIVSAIAERMDRSDALIDAVMAWESLVGTKHETVFRVTAALSKLVETNPTERRALRSQLGKTYDVRSRVVHGDTVDPLAVAQEADRAIDIALAATRALYGRRPEWLSYASGERADRLILEE